MFWHALHRKSNWAIVMTLVLCACRRGGSPKDPPIRGRPADPPTSMAVRWELGKRLLYHVDVSSGAMVPRRNTTKLVHTETTFGQDLSFTVTNAPEGDDARLLLMELLALQMETSRDDGVTMTFDSDNKAVFTEDNPLSDRLQKLVGLKLTFHVSADNRVTRVDGMREVTDRVSGGNVVRGAPGVVLSRFFSQQYFRDLVEMGLLPKEPVKVGDSWTVSRQGTGGIWGTPAQMELSCKFLGWQLHDGTNCARVDFSGTFSNVTANASAGASTNNNAPPGLPGMPGGPGPGRRNNMRMPGGNGEEGTVTGRYWFNRDLALVVETVFDQTLTSRSTTMRRMTNMTRTTNMTAMVVRAAGTNGFPPTPRPSGPGAPPAPRGPAGGNPPPPPPPDVMGPNGPANGPPGGPTVVTITTTNTTQWHVTLKLLEVETLTRP